ncbi:hypothetical protein OHA72_50350 [Dactylosporangium sp. NBC_01737]|uniref:hypothetical protein n=1 Tax=Dactylosporangium sp. NBC_01737 TaxID=2975959 RepID=UPI002E15F3D8|nr:hypothetical protein OHA72_50350 [Dactylosporangium sp. NBC_01737]
MREEHPIDNLVVVVEGKASDAVTTALRSSADGLAGRRSWVLGPPEFCDESSGGIGSRIVGLALSVHATLPPWGEELDGQVRRAHLEEVQEVLGEVCRISERHNVSFDVYYGPELVGSVEDGRTDDSLLVGLVGGWKDAIDGSEGHRS